MPPVRVLHLTAPVYRALAGGDLAAANAVSPVPVTPYLLGPHCARVWRVRHRQVRDDPACAAWVTGIVWDQRERIAVGMAGFHGPPDAAGMVEVGYSVDPAYRRRGYARAALAALLRRAAGEEGVRTVRASIAPDNDASYRLVAQFGFREVGEQWDDDEGLEIIYERSASSPARGPGPASPAGPVTR